MSRGSKASSGIGQGDVYHLLFNLGEWLDGRVWLKKDRLDVQRLLDLIHHVTGELGFRAQPTGWMSMAGCFLPFEMVQLQFSSNP